MATPASQQYTAKRLTLAGQCDEEQRRYRETMEKLQAAVKGKGCRPGRGGEGRNGFSL